MPIEALIVMATAWGLGALTVLATQWASLQLRRTLPQQKRTVALAAAVAFFWIMATGLIAASGNLSDFSKTPPPFPVFVFVCFVLTVCTAFSAYGTLWIRGLSFSLLIGFQVFRLAAEALLYFGYRHGQVPVQMTFEGWNWDVLTGLTALPMAWWVARTGSRRGILVWNLVGLALLLTVVGVALASKPAFATHFPYVWLPAVLVQYAFLGHLLCLRKLWDTRH